MSFRGNMRRNTNQMPARGGGPLMTDHLQTTSAMQTHSANIIQDLELELELLKRKRQLIQRQQSDMLYNNAPAGNTSYNQPSQSFNDRFNEPQHLNFSHLYTEAPRDDRSFGVKRRAQADWPNAPGANPMGGNKRPRQGQPNRQNFQNNSQPFQNSQTFIKPRPNNQPKPLLGQPMPKPLMNFGAQARRGPQPLKKPNQGPKPLTHHPNFKQNKPGPNRPNFTVKNTASPKKPAPNTPIKNTTPKSAEKKQAQIYRPDKQLDNKSNGRLELALGLVVKEIKATYGNKPEYRNLFNIMPLARLMKQGIRERVHSAMTGKVIGTANDILAEYRQKFPVDTDKEIVELAVVEQQKNFQKSELAIKLLEEGDPELFFKKNMQKLLQSRFGEMMEKLEKMVNEENKAVTNTQILEHLPDLKKTPEDVTATQHTAKPAEETVKTTEETVKTTEETVKTTEEVVTVDEESVKATEDTVKNAEEPVKVAEDTANADVEMIKADGETAMVADETPADFKSKAKDYDKWLSLYIQRRLPGLVTNYRNMILKIFDLDHMYRNTKAAIIINANNKAQARNISKAGYTNSDQGKDDPELPRNLPYFAKVLAIPAMPKRKVMQEFLNKFQPKTIKRHKKNYNLLFVGFDSKENYDKILAANQTTIGNSTLSIVGNIAKTTTIEIDDQNENEIDQVLTPQLDDQINDLLSSIRKADEDSKGNESQITDIDLTMDASDEQETQEQKADANGNENAANETAEATDGAEKSEAANDNIGDANVEENNAVGNGDNDECQVVEGNGNNVVTIEDDEVAPLNTEEAIKPATPAKGRAPATPNPTAVRTRRSSRLVPN